MTTFNSSSYTLVSSHSFVKHVSFHNFPSSFIKVNPGTTKGNNSVYLKSNLARGSEFVEEKKRVSRWSCWCKKDWNLDVDDEDEGFQENGSQESSLTSFLSAAAKSSWSPSLSRRYLEVENEVPGIEITVLESLKSDLSSILQTLRSYEDKVLPKEVSDRLSSLLSMLHKENASYTDIVRRQSDTQKSLENELKKARDESQSIRARVREAQKMLEEKQKRIDYARRALELLRIDCIVWVPKNASEVLLAGSFDGWTTKRTMEKNSNGAFCLSMKLYPGKYEIKFIVDGEWTADPSQLIVFSNGQENNLLVVQTWSGRKCI